MNIKKEDMLESTIVVHGAGEMVSKTYAIAVIEQLEQQVERMNPFNQPPINKHGEYAKAIITLINMASQDCGGSGRCAQVLLSLYNGTEWHADLADIFCGLDSKHTEAAFTAIRYRAELMSEPHKVIENGDKIFDQLWKRWAPLHVAKRYKRYYKDHN